MDKVCIYLKVENGTLYTMWSDYGWTTWEPWPSTKYYRNAREGIWEIESHCQRDNCWESLYYTSKIVIIEEDNDN